MISERALATRTWSQLLGMATLVAITHLAASCTPRPTPQMPETPQLAASPSPTPVVPTTTPGLSAPSPSPAPVSPAASQAAPADCNVPRLHPGTLLWIGAGGKEIFALEVDPQDEFPLAVPPPLITSEWDYMYGSQWEPSGDRFSFVATTMGQGTSSTGFVASPARPKPTPITGTDYIGDMSWCPETGAIVFDALGEGLRNDSVFSVIRSLRVQGDMATYDHPGGEAFHPVCSPDGERVAFFVEEAPPRGPALVVSDIALAQPSIVARPDPGLEFAKNLAWSPDGENLTYQVSANWTSLGLCISPSTPGLDEANSTSEPCPIPGTEDALSPEWSPNGRYILFTTEEDFAYRGVYIIDLGVAEAAAADSPPEVLPMAGQTPGSPELSAPAIWIGPTTIALVSGSAESGWSLFAADPFAGCRVRIAFLPSAATDLSWKPAP